MERTMELRPVFVEEMPSFYEYGVLYISKEYKTAVHLCACGCLQKTVTPLGGSECWTLQDDSGLITLRPSIGNFKGENPYHAHYFITQNKIDWL